MKNEAAKAVNPGRHERCCKICSHKKREDIEQDFVAWKSPRKGNGLTEPSVNLCCVRRITPTPIFFRSCSGYEFHLEFDAFNEENENAQ